MLRRSPRWLNTQPPGKFRAMIMPKPGSAGLGSTPATATTTATATATLPPEGDVLGVSKIPCNRMLRATCACTWSFKKPGPAGWSSALTRPPPGCNDVEKAMGQCSSKGIITATKPPLFQSTTSDILVGEYFGFIDGATQDLRFKDDATQGFRPATALAIAKFSIIRRGTHQAVLTERNQMPPGTRTTQNDDDVIHDDKTTLSCNNQESLNQNRGALSGITALSPVADSETQAVHHVNGGIKGQQGASRGNRQSNGGIMGMLAKNPPGNLTEVGIHRRFYSRFDWKEPISAPGPPPDNLLEVIKPCVNTKTKMFKVNVDNSEDLLRSVDRDKEVVRKALDITSLMDTYYRKVRQALLDRGMICLKPLEDEETKRLHNTYRRITGRFPTYMTCLDVMENLKVTEDGKWTASLDSFSHHHVFVIEDWTRSFYTSSGYTFYDRGLRVGPNRGKAYIRGECDGSFNHQKKTAKISKLFWKKDQVLSCTVFYGIPCTNSVEAEALAMYFLLKTGVIYDKLEVSSDSDYVIRVLKGYQKVTRDNENYDLLMLLRYLRRCYSELRPRWQNRENLLFVDSLLRGEENYEYEIGHTKAILARWAPALRGDPIYIVAGHSPPEIKKLAHTGFRLTEFQQTCYCEVKQNGHKLAAVWHIISSLEASYILLVVPKFESRPDLQKEYDSLFGTSKVLFKEGPYSVLEIPPPTNACNEKSSIPVVILFEATLARNLISEYQSYFLVVLSTPDERPLITELNLQPLSPLSFVSVQRRTNEADVGTSGTNAANMGS